MRIGIFGSSLNPPTGTGGHAGLARAAAGSGAFDRVWILPVYHHPFATSNPSLLKKELISFEDRMAMAELNFANLDGVEVSPAERDAFDASSSRWREETMGTVDVLDYLLAKFPQHQFGLILGQDAYASLPKWKGGREGLAARAALGFLLFARDDDAPLSVDQAHSSSVRFCELDENGRSATSVSSTRLRAALGDPDTESSGEVLSDPAWVHPAVRDYALQHRLWPPTTTTKL